MEPSSITLRVAEVTKRFGEFTAVEGLSFETGGRGDRTFYGFDDRFRTPFNDGKSDLKMLDYGIFGIPGIFSDVPSYHDTVKNGENGLLVPNNAEAWQQALEAMASDTALRQKMAAAVKQEVWDTRTLAQNAWRWLDAVEKIVSQSVKKAA